MLIKNQNRAELYFLFIIIAIAIVLRSCNLSFSLSNDELSALVRLKYNTLHDVIAYGVKPDGHPAGVQVFLFYWVKIFGDSETSVRLPFVFAGIISVVFAFLISSLWFGKRTALFVAASMAFLQFPLLFSQIARPYGSGLMISMLMVYCWTRMLFPSPETKKHRKFIWATCFGFLAVAALYNHYFSGYFALVVGITGFFFLNRNNWKPYILSGILAAILFLPHLPITLNHLKMGGVGEWLGKPGSNWIFQHLGYIFNNSILLFIVILFIITTNLLIIRKIKFSKFRLISILWFFIPFITGYVYSQTINPVLQNTVLIFSFPFILFFIFSFIPDDKRKLYYFLLGGYIIAGIVDTVIINKYYQTQHFGEFKDVAKRVTSWDKKYGSNNVTRAISVNNPYYIDYYLKRNDHTATFQQYHNQGGKDLLAIKKIAYHARTPYFVYAWTKPVLSEIDNIIRQYFPCIVERVNYKNLSEITLYSKNEHNCITPVKPSKTIFNTFDSIPKWESEGYFRDTLLAYSGRYSLLIDSLHEYSPGLKTNADFIQPDALVKIKVMVYTTGKTNAQLVFSLENERKGCYFWAASNFDNYTFPGSWEPVFFNLKMPKIKSKDDILKIYVWNTDLKTFRIDNFEIDVFEMD